MTFDTLFSLTSMLAMAGWLFLLASPLLPTWSDRIAGLIIPAVLSVSYVVLLLFFSSGNGGYGSLAQVTELFSQSSAVLAGWIHFLAFDLIIGAWICRTARGDGIAFWMVIPILIVTFLFGPAGFLAFLILRMFRWPKSRLSQP